MNIQYASSLVFSQITDTDYEETFVIGEGGKVTLCLYGVLTRDIRISPTICLAGASASCQVVGLFLVRQGSVSIHTLQDHQAGHTKSDLLIKCVVDGQSSVSYRGSIRVNKDAQGTDAYQRNENLLISKTAAAVSKTELEILANDVR